MVIICLGKEQGMTKNTVILAILLVILLVPLSISGCSRVGSAMTGSGNITDQNIKLDDFTEINVQGDFEVEIKQSDDFNINISTDDNLINRILISRDDETLKIGIQAPANFFPTSLKIAITMPRIYGLDLSKGAKASISGFDSTFNFDLEMSDGATLTGDLESGITEFDISSGSQANLAGQALEMDLNASGGSKINLEEFAVGDARASLKGGSEAIMNVDGEFDVALTEASKISYVGTPTLIYESVSSDSTIERK
jgi:hypothetical protein